jgi:hypothetical protein
MSLAVEILQAIDPHRIIEGAAAIAKVRGQLEKRVSTCLSGMIDADKVGRIWITTARRALRPVAGKKGDEIQ